MDEEPGGNSDDPVVLENLKETFRHSTIGELTSYYVLSKLGIENIPKDSFHTYLQVSLLTSPKIHLEYSRFSGAIDDSIRKDVFLAVECWADVEVFVSSGQNCQSCLRDNEALGGNENENEEDNEGNENEEDNETESESGNENEESGLEADPVGLETDQEADSDDV
ncbi:hypothetical protein MTR67_030572 [Solanum verrucosum]|uniref:Uncharacterized protein n=1 Tax=Solanum verrucosum TaxID=315347 RepID=A0AAF0RB76_SOLVR|nr:hypothetical protein MTR67_030572 [Solanum verrucosum]